MEMVAFNDVNVEVGQRLAAEVMADIYLGASLGCEGYGAEQSTTT